MCCTELKEILQAEDKKECFSKATSAKEKGKEFVLNNVTRKTICRVRVDDCLITDLKLKKCDYLFKICENKQYFLVELKGLNIYHAVDQIINTYEVVNKKIKTSPNYFEGFIISSSVPVATDLRFRKMQQKWLKEKGIMISKSYRKFIKNI